MYISESILIDYKCFVTPIRCFYKLETLVNVSVLLTTHIK